VNLERLDLQVNQIKSVSPLKELTNLVDLKLWRNNISNVMPLSALTNLRTLNLIDNQITLSQVTALQEALADCVISHNATTDFNNVNIGAVNAVENGGWLELHNPTDTAISCKGMYLSNNQENMYLWQMPSVIIREGQTVRIRANSNSTCAVLKIMTTNFNFTHGDTLYLTTAAGEILHSYQIE